MTESSFRANEPSVKSEKNSSNENNSQMLQSPNPARPLLKEILSECAKKNQNVSPNSQLSNTLPAVVRPETRHHLIDVHGLALFLRKATRCIQCFKVGCLSMMGNISRQQPPCVTKITIKCQICSFILQEDLKTPKATLNIDNSIYNDNATMSPKDSLSSSSLEEVWVEETQKDSSSKEKNLPSKKKRKYSHNEDPLCDSKTKDTLQGTNSSSLNLPRRKHFLTSPIPKIENRLTQSDQHKCSEEARTGTNNLEENNVKPKDIFTANKNTTDFKNKRRLSMDENVFAPCSADERFPKSRSSVESSISRSMNDEDGHDTSFSNCCKETSFITKAKDVDFSSNIPELSKQGALHTSVVSKIIQEFEKVQTNICPRNRNKTCQKVKIEELGEENPNVKASESKNEILSKGFQYFDSITVKNLNVSNINFQHDSSSPLFQSQSSTKIPELRDARIINKLINLTESLKEELVERKKEIAANDLEKNEHSTANIKIKKEPEDTIDDSTESRYRDVSEFIALNTFKVEREPQLIVPDIYIKKETIFGDAPTTDNHDTCHSDYDEPTTNVASSDTLKFDFESDESEIDVNEVVRKNLPSVSKSFSGT